MEKESQKEKIKSTIKGLLLCPPMYWSVVCCYNEIPEGGHFVKKRAVFIYLCLAVLGYGTQGLMQARPASEFHFNQWLWRSKVKRPLLSMAFLLVQGISCMAGDRQHTPLSLDAFCLVKPPGFSHAGPIHDLIEFLLPPRGPASKPCSEEIPNSHLIK